jgi:hypothetical protein
VGKVVEQLVEGEQAVGVGVDGLEEGLDLDHESSQLLSSRHTRPRSLKKCRRRATMNSRLLNPG